MKGYSLFKMIVSEQFPNRYQVLCFNCHQGKTFYGYCPHQIQGTRAIGEYASTERFVTGPLTKKKFKRQG